MNSLLIPRHDNQPAKPRRHVSLAAAVLLGSIAAPAYAIDINTDTPELKVRWDNTVKYSNAFRLRSQNAGLIASPNLDDGDRNFGKGLISNRVDLFSEVDVQYRDVGFRASGAAWYDTVYNRGNDHDSPFTANQSSVPYNEFTLNTRDRHGRQVELLDAFAFARFNIGETRSLVRVGRHALVWGESLFYGANAIAGGMAPVDVTKLISVPGTQFKEAIRPVNQLSGQIQLTPAVSLGMFYQLRWEANRFPAVGSYFSNNDLAVDGAERILAGPFAFPRGGDLKPKNSGQGGVQLKFSDGETDYGLYALRFHSKAPQLVTNVSPTSPVGFDGYYLPFHQGIRALGASASRSFGSANFAIEGSIRSNQDLASQGLNLSGLGLPAANNSSNPGYATGRTAHINVSSLWSVEPTALFSEASLVGEIAWNRVLSCERNCDVIDSKSTRDAVALRLLFEPTYRQVVPGVDLSIPMGIGYAPKGSRSRALGPGAFPAENGGDITLGVNATYLDGWRFTLSMTHYYGGTQPFLVNSGPVPNYSYGQTMKDRDFVAFSVRRTF